MAEKNIKSRIIHKHDVESNWELATGFIPKQGEIIVYDVDENYTYERFKIGDGETLVSELPFSVIQPDWSVSDELAANYIHNKPDVKKVTLTDGTINIWEYESGFYQFVSEAESGRTKIYGKSGTGEAAAAEFQEILAYNTVDAIIVKYTSGNTIIWRFLNLFASTSAYEVLYDSDTDTWTTNADDLLSKYIKLPYSNGATSYGTSGQVLTSSGTHLPTWTDLPQIDSELSDTSENAVQNKVVNVAISNLNTLVGDTSVSEQIAAANIIYVGPDMPTDTKIKVWINTAEESTGIIPVLPRVATITLAAANWTGGSAPYSQVVEINTVTSATKIDLQPTVAQITSLQNDDIALMAENIDGVVTIYSFGGKPSADMTMQALLTEVSYV